ncbi:diguanylate cyclase domain-containing protein [Methylocucumis oryzae]|uniref:diguanylate cyclase domain-containing protein n=1 Tax=Methylocucumis oryzae TaxID=1632867 RepID=UPI000697D85F|nr:diguanylate cyclase [Methylocucumis oryzae]
MLTEKLSYQASHDPLTQLINRNEFDRRLERAVWSAQKKGYEHALCYLDLDQFKVVNDTCSHMAGDELLRQISAQLTKILREKDTLARIGGDEFAIIMEHCSLEQAECVTKKIHQLVEQFQFQWEDKSFRVGVSIGLVIIKHASLGPETYLKQADMACYLAKDAGRNRTHIYNDDDQALIQHHGEMNWIARINQALEEDSFCLYAQSIIPLSGNGGEHYEILVRKRNNDEIILPGAFMPAAERFQLSPKIDRWVISKVFDYFNNHPERLKSLSICSINLSGLSLNDPGLCAFIEQKLQHSKLPASKVCFEITETATIANFKHGDTFYCQLKSTRL